MKSSHNWRLQAICWTYTDRDAQRRPWSGIIPSYRPLLAQGLLELWLPSGQPDDAGRKPVALESDREHSHSPVWV
jgi:hypothetical protein